MYSMLKKIITEKDIYRQIILLEQLLNHPKLTAKELASKTGTTERTIFSDLQLIRDYLPPNWKLATNSQGIHLVPQKKALTNELWEAFFPHSVSLQLIKQLFFTKNLHVPTFLAETGVSYETLKRQRTKINRQLEPYQIKISLTAQAAQLVGDESAIRIFYHRLLVPFTHNNYFFEEYSIHEEHYFFFLTKSLTQAIRVETEEIFGICWFFINSIRIKAGCRIDQFSYEAKDPLFLLYQTSLTQLYEKEGIYLQEDELFFAFFCFLESWNYNNQFGQEVTDTLNNGYPELLTAAQQIVLEIAAELPSKTLLQTNLSTNLLLLLLKYAESPNLSQQFQLEYQDLLVQRKADYPLLTEKSLKLFNELQQFSVIEDTTYFVNLFTLLSQQAIFSVQPQRLTIFFVFQSEPAWKVFLQQELADFLGKRVQLIPLEVTQLQEPNVKTGTLILSNIPLDMPPIPVFYLSTNPTKNELSQLAELTSRFSL